LRAFVGGCDRCITAFEADFGSIGRLKRELHRFPGSSPCPNGFITVIKCPSDLWAVEQAAITPYNPAKPRQRQIHGGPLINLGALQALLKSGSFDTDQLWLATDKCVRDLQSERWSTEDVLYMLVNLVAGEDYSKSEWCQVKGGHMVPCDVFNTYYDAERKSRNIKALPVYIKFSIDADGLVTIALVSCHA
jgi:hypothetical protein